MAQIISDRYGVIEISHEILSDDYEGMAKIFGEIGFLPVRVEAFFHKNVIRYEGYCPSFHELKEGAAAPRYTILITKVEGEITTVKVERRV